MDDVMITFRAKNHEKAILDEKAKQCALTRSQYVKKTALGIVPRSHLDQRVIQTLLTLNADIGRVGGLLKLWLVNHNDAPLVEKIDVRELVTEIRSLKNEIKNVVSKL